MPEKRIEEKPQRLGDMGEEGFCITRQRPPIVIKTGMWIDVIISNPPKEVEDEDPIVMYGLMSKIAKLAADYLLPIISGPTIPTDPPPTGDGGDKKVTIIINM